MGDTYGIIPAPEAVEHVGEFGAYRPVFESLYEDHFADMGAGETKEVTLKASRDGDEFAIEVENA